MIRRHLLLEMYLDLTTVEVILLQKLAADLAHQRLVVSTLQAEYEADADSLARIYECHNICRRRQPPVELRQEPIPYPRWEEIFWSGAAAMADAYFVVKMVDAGKPDYIGVCAMVGTDRGQDIWESGFTGVVPAWAGRGVAKGLKAQSLLYARKSGVRGIKTICLKINHPVVRLNQSLGFDVVRRRLKTFVLPN